MRNAKLFVFPALAAPSIVLAAGGGGLSSIVSPDPGSMLWTIITFILLLLVLWKFAWGPILRGLETRENNIRSAIEQSQKDREEAAKLLREYEEKLKSASAEINERLTRAEQDAQQRIEQAKNDARDEAEKILAKARADIEADKTKVIAELRQELADITSKVAAAAIRESFNRDDQLRIIRNRLESMESNS